VSLNRNYINFPSMYNCGSVSVEVLIISKKDPGNLHLSVHYYLEETSISLMICVLEILLKERR